MIAAPRRAAGALAVAGALALAAAGCGGSSAPAYRGTPLGPAASPAPQIVLPDQAGRTVRLSQFRGRAVLLAFLYTHCPDTCPLEAAKLSAALHRLGPAAAKVQVVAVSVDPKGDTPARVRAFVAAHGLTGRMRYLVGTHRQLTRVWHDYAVGVVGGGGEQVGHGAQVIGITAGGRRVVTYLPTFTVADLVHDVPLLARS